MRHVSYPCHSSPSSHLPITLQTDPQGRIHLPASWMRLFAEACNRFESLCLQTRHAYARLVTRFTPTPMAAIDGNNLLRSADHRLYLQPNSSSSIHAKIERCHCCGSPGRIEFRNRHGMEFLQLCSTAELPASEWASFVQQLTSDPSTDTIPSQPPSFPQVPGDAKPLPFHPSLLATILEMLRDQAAAIEVTLVNAESINRRILYLDTIEHDDEFVSAYGEESSFQLGLAAVRCLHLGKRSSGAPLVFAAGPDNAQLLAIEPANDPFSRAAFAQILEDLVPEMI